MGGREEEKLSLHSVRTRATEPPQFTGTPALITSGFTREINSANLDLKVGKLNTKPNS